MSLKISFESGKPLFLQLQELIRTDIAAGKYSPGETLPGVRDLAISANVNPNTMQRALAELEAEGLLVPRGTSGRFICPNPAVIEEAKRKILAEHAKGFLMKCRELGVDRNEAAQILLDIGKTNFSERTDTENEYYS